MKNSFTKYHWKEIKKRALSFIRSSGVEITSQNHFCRLVSDLTDMRFETVKYNLGRKKYTEMGGGQVNGPDCIESSYTIIGEFTQHTPPSYYDIVKAEYHRLLAENIKPTAKLIALNLSIYIDTSKKHLANVRKELKTKTRLRVVFQSSKFPKLQVKRNELIEFFPRCTKSIPDFKKTG